MDAPNMRAYVESLIGQTVYTAVENRPNTVVAVCGNQAIVRTRDGKENPASLIKLQDIANAVWSGEDVTLETRGRRGVEIGRRTSLRKLRSSFFRGRTTAEA